MTDPVSPVAHPASVVGPEAEQASTESPSDSAGPPHAGSQSLEDRYNTGRRRNFDRRFGWGAAGVLVLAGVGFLLFSGWQTTEQVSVQDIGFSAISDHEVQVKFEVTSNPQTRVACAIEALNTSKATVGWNVLELPVSENRIHTVTTKLMTTGPMTAANVRACWVASS